MVGPDPWRGQQGYHDIARIRRDNELFDWEWALMTYLTVVLVDGEKLRFSLGTGQPVYNVFNTEMQVVRDAVQPLDVYLDASRRWRFHPSEILLVGISTMETFLIRIDFSIQPEFDTTIYNRLRLGHLLRSVRVSSPAHFRKLLFLYQFRQYCQLVLPTRYYRIPPLEDAYAFLERKSFL